MKQRKIDLIAPEARMHLLPLAVTLLLAYPPDASLNDIDGVVEAAIKKGDMPGAVVLVLRDDVVVYKKAFGRRAMFPEPTLMTEDTVFDLASLTKPIATAMSIMLLVEDGKLKLDDPISKYLPAFARKETESITIAELLTHVSGFIADNPEKDYHSGVDTAWKNLFALEPTQAPGSKFVYSDMNFILLGKIVEKTSGMRVDEFSRKRVFEPLGMKETGFLPGPELRKRAAPTEKRNGQWMMGEVHDPRSYLLGGVAGHAGLFSTANDLAIFARMMLHGGKLGDTTILRPETYKLMTTPLAVPTEKGTGYRTYGWDVDTPFSKNRGTGFGKTTGFGHTGFTGTSIWIDPPTKTAVIFLSNRVHPEGKGNVVAVRGQVATIAATAK
jgi:CubicO group peptidase (beta-lactamase class C family)